MFGVVEIKDDWEAERAIEKLDGNGGTVEFDS